MHAQFFFWCNPEAIFVFDRNLASHIFATKRLVAGEPIGGILVGFFLVCRAVNRDEI